jgi:hypothetical protein
VQIKKPMLLYHPQGTLLEYLQSNQLNTRASAFAQYVTANNDCDSDSERFRSFLFSEWHLQQRERIHIDVDFYRGYLAPLQIFETILKKR